MVVRVLLILPCGLVPPARRSCGGRTTHADGAVGPAPRTHAGLAAVVVAVPAVEPVLGGACQGGIAQLLLQPRDGRLVPDAFVVRVRTCRADRSIRIHRRPILEHPQRRTGVPPAKPPRRRHAAAAAGQECQRQRWMNAGGPAVMMVARLLGHSSSSSGRKSQNVDKNWQTSTSTHRSARVVHSVGS